MTFQNLFEVDAHGKLVRKNKTKTINDTLQNIYKKRFKRQTLNHFINIEEENIQHVWKQDVWFQGLLNNDNKVEQLENEYKDYCKIVKECHETQDYNLTEHQLMDAFPFKSFYKKTKEGEIVSKNKGSIRKAARDKITARFKS